MEKIIFTNSKGHSITLGKTKPYFLQFLDGAGGSETDIQMQKAPYQDGQTYIDTLFEMRTLTFEVSIMADSEQDLFQRRADLVRVFNAKLGRGKLRYEYPGGSKEIECVIDMAPVFLTGKENRGMGYQRTMFTLVCPSPFWTDTVQTGVKLEDFVASFRFPLRFPVRFSTRGDLRILTNVGDVPTPVQVEFRGLASNPKIVNETTGEFIQVKKEILTGQKLLINTEFGNKYVKLIDFNGAESNAFSFIDLESSFFSLIPGENKISFITDGGNPEVFIRYKNRYVGV